MTNEKPGFPEVNRESPSPLAGAPRVAWQPLAFAGGLGAAVGLVLGIFLGRATVIPSESTPVSESKRALQQSASPSDPRAQESRQAPGAYVLEFGRPAAKAVQGVKREFVGSRPAARLEEKAAKLAMPLTPTAGAPYALTAVIQFEGDDPATLVPSVNDTELEPWSLSTGWRFYSVPVASDLLEGSGGTDVLLSTTGLAGDDAVRIDSIGLVPMKSELRFDVADSSGHLVDGFSAARSRYVWSEGERSVIGVALAPEESDYELGVRASAFPPLDPLSVVLHVNGKKVGAASVSKKVETVRWTIPAGVLRSGSNELTFEYAQTGQPSKFDPSSKDTRQLAMRFYSVNLDPLD